MIFDNFPGNRPGRRARSGKPENFPHGIFLRAQRTSRRPKWSVSDFLPCRWLLDFRFFPASPLQEPAENRPLKPTDTGSGRGWERGSPGHPRILRKTICIFQPCTSFPYKKLDISQSLGKHRNLFGSFSKNCTTSSQPFLETVLENYFGFL